MAGRKPSTSRAWQTSREKSVRGRKPGIATGRLATKAGALVANGSRRWIRSRVGGLSATCANILSPRSFCRHAAARLAGICPCCYRAAMYALARFIQMAGLAIPPLAIIAQLMDEITLGQMLGFLTVSVGLFLVGYLLQRYSGGGP
jgi:hypothetical protein